METLINELEHMAIKDHVLGVFGSKSWGGGGLKRLNKFAEEIKWETIETTPEALCAPHKEDFDLCEALAEGMAARLNELYK